MNHISALSTDTAQPATPVAPNRYRLLLQDSFSAFDLMTVIETLKEANRRDAETLYDWKILSESGAPVTASNGIAISVDGGLVELDRRETLIVFGGDNHVATSTLPVLAWLRRQARLGLRIGAISGGVFTLLKAGVLREAEVTTHWSYRASIRESFQGVDVNKAIFSLGDKRFTCAGGVATLDLMLHLLSREQGTEMATWVADNMVCSSPRTEGHEQVLSKSTRTGDRNAKVAEAVQLMQDNLEFPIPPSQIAHEIGISARQLERLFSRYLAYTPKAYYMKLRMEHARCLLLQTDMRIMEVALACGFSGASHFSKLYKKRFGFSPYKERGFGETAT